jgi:hypothetical protein
MNFKQYLQECECEMPALGSAPLDSGVISSINSSLDVELDDILMTPESGVQRLRKVLMRYNIELPALYGLDPEGDEIALPINNDVFVYIIYCPTDDGRYDFYAELTDEEGLEEILGDEEDDTED